MTNYEHLGEPGSGQLGQQPTELYTARSALVETIAEHTRTLLPHAHPLVKIAAELIETGKDKPPYPTGDESTLPPALREFVRRSLIEEALWEVRHGTPLPGPDPSDIPSFELSPEEMASESYQQWVEILQQWEQEQSLPPDLAE